MAGTSTPAHPWHWRADSDPGDGLLDSTFPSQGEAVTWLGEFYPELRERGVRSVSLHEAHRLVYGPMGLDPA